MNETDIYIYLSEQITAHGYTNQISYNKNGAETTKIYPTKDTRKTEDNIRIFYSSDTKNHYRIPVILTLKNGDILAFADKRYNGSGDLPNRIEVMVIKKHEQRH